MYRLLALLCLVVLVQVAPAAAQTPIHRCIGADGSPVFTDQPCAALQASPVTAAPGAGQNATSGPPPVLCAGNIDVLRQSVLDAFARGDANRMAGLMLWDGYGHGAAIADIRSLTDAMKQPLLGVDIPDQSAPAPASSLADPFSMDVSPTPPRDASQLVLQLAGGDGDSLRELRFNVVRQAGCLWLRNAD
ncbi:MAG TPA: DUF4124 domain-containing protein [Rhodanobacter sp.]